MTAEPLDSEKKTIAEMLRQNLYDSGRTQSEAARFAEINEGLFSRLVRGQRTSVSDETAQKIAKLIGMSLEDFLGVIAGPVKRTHLRTNSRLLGQDSRLIEHRFFYPFLLKKHFSGRIKERKALTNWLDRGLFSVYVIDSLRGQGASSLIWIWLRQDLMGIPIPGENDDLDDVYPVPADCRPEFVFYYCFREPNAGFKDFLIKAVRFLGEEEVDLDKMSSEELADSLMVLLQRHRTLLALDSLDELLCIHNKSDKAVDLDSLLRHSDFREGIIGRFLGRLTAVSTSRAIITTHLVPAALRRLAGCTIESLEPLSIKDSVRFLKRMGLDDSNSCLESYVHECQGNPLALRLMAEARLHQQTPGMPAPDTRTLLRQMEVSFEPALSRSVISLAERLAMLEPVISRESVFEAAMRSPTIVNDERELAIALRELEDFGLLSTEDDMHFTLHAVFRRLILSHQEAR